MSRHLPPSITSAAAGVAEAIRFYSRLPVPILPFEREPHGPPDFGSIAPALPFAALAIAAPSALVLWFAAAVGLAPAVAALLTLATSVVTTGVFHEDGLADFADSFGGSTRERRLEIMRDSRIGAYGAAALALGLMLRATLLASLLTVAGTSAAVAAWLLAAVLSRVAGLCPLAVLAPARVDGAAAAVKPPTMRAFAMAITIGLLTATAVAAIGGVSVKALGFAGVAMAGVATGMTALASRRLGGQTGDVAGATQQLAEIAGLLAILAVMPYF